MSHLPNRTAGHLGGPIESAYSSGRRDGGQIGQGTAEVVGICIPRKPRLDPPRLPEDESLLKNMPVVTLDEPFKLSVPDSPRF